MYTDQAMVEQFDGWITGEDGTTVARGLDPFSG